MQIEIPYRFERLGAVRVFETQRILELDYGLENGSLDTKEPQPTTVQKLPSEQLHEVEREMAIVVPCKQERLKILEGVLSGIPHRCLTILVSNSSRHPVDRFELEREALSQFCGVVQRSAIIVHQRDPGLAKAFKAGGFEDLINKDGQVYNGKAEGMIIGLTLAKLCGKKYVGFIDADNYFPGAVNEYVKDFAAGFCMAKSPYSMVRLTWRSKPKIKGSRLYFSRWGRVSENTNRFLNSLISEYTGFGTEIIKTGNAGEHAFSVKLGELLSFSTGYSVEPYEIINLFEQFGGIESSQYPEVMKQGAEIYQIETRNPHLHENKGEDHIDEMRDVAMNTIYHSRVCPVSLKEAILRYLLEQGSLKERQEPNRERKYPPLSQLDEKAFLEVLDQEGITFEQIRRIKHQLSFSEPPIVSP